MDLEDPTVEEEVVLEDQIIQSVDESMDTVGAEPVQVKEEPSVESEPATEKKEEPTSSMLSTTDIKEESILPEQEVDNVEQEKVAENEGKVIVTEEPSTSEVQEEKEEVTSSASASKSKADESPMKPVVVLNKVKEIVPEKKDVKPETPVKETRSLRASRDSDIAEKSMKRDEAPVLETRERRRSRIVEDKSPVREVKVPPSPVKETRSSRQLREEVSSPVKETREGRSLRSRDTSPRGKEDASPVKEARPPPRSPRHSKDVESPVKEARRRDEVKESPHKRKSLADTPSKVGERRKLRSESEIESEMRLRLLNESEDSNEGEDSSDILKEMQLDMRKTLNASPPPGDVTGEEFKTPALSSGAGQRKRSSKGGSEGRASPFLNTG